MRSTRRRIDLIENALQSSFIGVKKDIHDVHHHVQNSYTDLKNSLDYVFKWIEYLQKKSTSQDEYLSHLHDNLSKQFDAISRIHEKALQHDSRISNLSDSIVSRHDLRNEASALRVEMKRYIDDYYNLKPLLERLDRVEERISELSNGLNGLASKGMQHAQPVASFGIKELRERIQKLEERKLSMRERIIKKISKNSKEYIKSVVLSYIRKYEKISAVRLKEMVVEEQGLCSKSSFYRILEEIEDSDDVGVVKTNKEKHYFFKIAKKL